jgi:uncharacterized protein (TIGR03085 family)
VHHEDVRRAKPGWVPRELPADLADELWKRLGQLGRLMYRHVPVGVTLVRTDGAGGQHVVRTGTPMVTVTGTAPELLLRSYGRSAVVVGVSGAPGAVASFEGSSLGV